MEKILYQQSQFYKSAAKLSDLPKTSNGEVAFIGRSNVGKSSVLNTLTQQKALAKVSRTPGRTQLINYFSLPEDRFLVDLPGYGFAKVDDKTLANWQDTLEKYLKTRKSLLGLVLIIDCRHPLKTSDQQMIEWTDYYDIPTHLVLNKADKISKSAGLQALKTLQKQLAQYELSAQLFSALKKQGVEALAEQLDHWFLSQ